MTDLADADLATAAARIRAEVRRSECGLAALVTNLVETESHCTQPAGTEAVARTMARELEKAGFRCERRSLAAPSAGEAWLAGLFLPGASYPRLPAAVVARRPGNGPRVLLLADLDTSYPAGSIDSFPFMVADDGIATGPGIADMKGGLAALAIALQALAAASLPAPAMTVVLAPDEQAGSLGSRPLITDEARRADCCLCLECAREGGKLLASRAQVGVARVSVQGREAHLGSAHGQGADALLALATLIPQIDRLTDTSRETYVTVTMTQGGRRRSVVAAQAWCLADVRTPDDATWHRTEAALRALVDATVGPPFSAAVEMTAHRPAVAWTDGTQRLLGFATRAGRALGMAVEATRSAGGGSSAFAGELGLPVLDGMGPAGGDLMTQHEYIDLAGAGDRAALLALTLHMLAVGWEPQPGTPERPGQQPASETATAGQEGIPEP